MMEKIIDYFYNFAMAVEQPLIKTLIILSRIMMLTGLIGAISAVGRDETALLTGADPEVTTVMMITSMVVMMVGLFLNFVTSRWQK